MNGELVHCPVLSVGPGDGEGTIAQVGATNPPASEVLDLDLDVLLTGESLAGLDLAHPHNGDLVVGELGNAPVLQASGPEVSDLDIRPVRDLDLLTINGRVWKVVFDV